MKIKTSVSLMVALVLGLVTAKVGIDMLKRYRGAGGTSVQIITAKRDMEPGYIIEAEDVTLAEVPPRFVPPAAMKEFKDVVGRTVVTNVVSGQTLFEGLLAPKGTGSGWQAMVPAGMRAVTVDVSESSAVAGMLIPGCRVDVITTLRRGEQTIAKAIVENVKVQYVQRARSGYTSKNGQNTPIENGPVKTVTLLVTPKQASAIELSNSSGSKPRLVLRGSNDNGATGTDDGMISSNELMGIKDPVPASQPIVQAPPPPVEPFDNVKPDDQKDRKMVEIIRGSQEEKKYFEENKKDDGTTPTAEKSSAGAEPRTASGDQPAAPRHTEFRSISR